MSKENNQLGQTLVSGIIFLLLTLICVLYFLFISETYMRNQVNIQKNREELILKSSKIANILNEISVNNFNIISSLITFENAYAESFEIGSYFAFSQPYWKTYSLHKSKIGDEINYINTDTKNGLNKIYSSFALQSARGLLLAKSLAEKNSQLVNSLPYEMSRLFVQSSNSFVFCLALESQTDLYNKPGIHNFSLLENLYSFYLQKDSCKIFRPQKNIIKSIAYFSFIQYHTSQDIIDYSKVSHDFNKHSYGIWYVPVVNTQEFFNELKFVSNKYVIANKKLTIVSDFLSKLYYFFELEILNSDFFNSFSKDSNVRITHPNFMCNKKFFNEHDIKLISDDDFLFSKDCNVNADSFLKSFFYPNWVGLISSENVFYD
jgi:hypothetical protein